MLALRDGITQVKSPDDYFTLQKSLDYSILNSGIRDKEFQFLDVGGGSGSPFDWIFAKELLKNEKIL